MSPAEEVRITIRARGNSARIAVMASMPLTFGMRTSINVTSGRSKRNIRNASSPSVACATTLMSARALISPVMPAIMSG